MHSNYSFPNTKWPITVNPRFSPYGNFEKDNGNFGGCQPQIADKEDLPQPNLQIKKVILEDFPRAPTSISTKGLENLLTSQFS